MTYFITDKNQEWLKCPNCSHIWKSLNKDKFIVISKESFELILTYLLELRNKDKNINLIKYIEKLKNYLE